MRIQFRKILSSSKVFDLQKEEIKFYGEIRAKSYKLFYLKGKIQGRLKVVCDISGEEFLQEIDEDLVLYISDGIWDTQSQDSSAFDVIEFFDGFIDLDYILQSEIDSIQLDYHTKN